MFKVSLLINLLKIVFEKKFSKVCFDLYEAVYKMAVLIEAISVVIKAKQLLEQYPGGWKKFKEDVPNQTLCADGEIVRIGFMVPSDVEIFINSLQNIGLVFLKNETTEDIVVVDQQRGPVMNCPWIEYGKIELDGNPKKQISACRLKGSKSNKVVMPENWKYEDSLSEKYTFISSEDVDRRIIRFKNEENVETYFDLKTGEKVYVGRTNKDK